MNETLQGVVWGGAIGAISSVLTAVVAHYLTSTKDKKQLLRNKLEELYQQTLGLKTWNDKFATKVMKAYEKIIQRQQSVSEDAPRDDECPITRIAMLVDLYFPHLKKDVIALTEAENQVRHGFYEFLHGMTGTPQDMKALQMHMEQPQNCANKAIELFKNVIAREAEQDRRAEIKS